ncbi:hypothetical protein EIP91_004067 [Steccherinum ochraceum]|uniref:F-box domain-containing protein n=1 Tax=Steccherinum ochraceum TaxID=92696 RepID=A0A4R0RCP0_9APHY|nr:hypothetical protein EIP91_004067 [Steccherinum ochraceum]
MDGGAELPLHVVYTDEHYTIANMIISSIPVELVIAIFSLACTDDGQTGCALNATSKMFRDICLSSSVDLQCIGIHGAVKIQHFTEVISQREHRRVSTLFLSDETPNRGVDFEISRLILALLHTLSRPYLRILHVYMTTAQRFGSRSPPTDNLGLSVAWLPVDFSSLVDLHLSHHIHHSSFPYTSTTTFPAVRSLHIQSIPPDLITMLEREFPNLVNLTVDGPQLGYGTVELFHFLEEYCLPEPFSLPSLSSVVVRLTHMMDTRGRGQVVRTWNFEKDEWRDVMLPSLIDPNDLSDQVRVVHRDVYRKQDPLELEIDGRTLAVHPPPADDTAEVDLEMTARYDVDGALWRAGNDL